MKFTLSFCPSLEKIHTYHLDSTINLQTIFGTCSFPSLTIFQDLAEINLFCG